MASFKYTCCITRNPSRFMLLASWFFNLVIFFNYFIDHFYENSLLLQSTSKTPRRCEPSAARSLSEKIIEKTFYDTYSILLEKCPINTINKESFTLCLSRINLDNNNNATNSNKQSNNLPWWFHTMIRDAKSYNIGLDGEWHTLTSNEPHNIRMCSIEKVASSQWRRLFCALNNQTTDYYSPKICEPEEISPSSKNVQDNVATSSSSFVFFRDPLERFLSGYINKCLSEQFRTKEKHCEPHALFEDFHSENSVLNKLTTNKKQLFAAYVDSMPYKWNVHFFPQSLYCDGIYRYLNDDTDSTYDFIGNMGITNFYNDLQRFIQRYATTANNKGTTTSSFEEIVNNIFEVKGSLFNSNKLEKIQHIDTNTKPQKEKMSSSKHVKEYYTPSSLRKALEYFSIDYMLLNMTIPDWVDEMLLEDDGNDKFPHL